VGHHKVAPPADVVCFTHVEVFCLTWRLKFGEVRSIERESWLLEKQIRE
jgi:hypothetical protein